MTSSRIAGVVLAGGKSSRFGRDKAWEVLQGVTLLQHAVSALDGLAGEVVVVRAEGQPLPDVTGSATVKVIDDAFPNAGPLGGLVTAWTATPADVAIVTGCDMPLVQPALLKELVALIDGFDAVVPMAAGRLQPLCAVYARSCLPPLRRRLESENLSLVGALKDLSLREVPPDEWRKADPGGLSFLNINTDADLAAVEALLARRGTRRGLRCEVWLGDRRCLRPATHRTQHSGIYVCEVDAAVWGSLYEEVEEEEEEEGDAGQG